MRIVLSTLLLVATFAIAGATAVRADSAVRALLVLASNDKGESDPRLAAYEPNLRRILRFESYRLAGEGSGRVAAGARSQLALGQGHSLQLEATPSEGKAIKLRVAWQTGERTQMNTGLTLRAGVPAILGGPPSGKEGEVWAVILIAE